MRPWYAAADIFALTSLAEGMSNALLEAMARGLPVLGTRVSGTSDLVRDGLEGALAEAGNAGQIAEGLARLEVEDFRLQCGARARARVEEMCAIENVSARILEFGLSRKQTKGE